MMVMRVRSAHRKGGGMVGLGRREGKVHCVLCVMVCCVETYQCMCVRSESQLLFALVLSVGGRMC